MHCLWSYLAGVGTALLPGLFLLAWAYWERKKLPSQATGPLIRPRKPLASYIAKARRAALRRQQVVKW